MLRECLRREVAPAGGETAVHAGDDHTDEEEDPIPEPGRGLAPAFSTARFRVRAAVARRNGHPDRAVVHPVWAGTDRGGCFSAPMTGLTRRTLPGLLTV